MSAQRSRGFTLIELMIVLVVMTTMMAGVWSVTQSARGSVAANARAAEVAATSVRTIRRIGAFLRPAKLSTVQLRAIAADVTAGRAAAVGEWIFPPNPPDGLERNGIRFQAAEGLLSMNAMLSTSPRELTFEMDPTETVNGVDDDADGMADEGKVRLLHETSALTLAQSAEVCAFTISGRQVTVRLRCAKSGPQGPVQRAELTQSFYFRNN